MKQISKMSIKETEEGITESEVVEERGDESSMKSFLWHGGSVYDAWFSCASNQVLSLSNSHTKTIIWVLIINYGLK